MNRDYIQTLDPLFITRLSVLLESLNKSYDSNGMILEQDLIALYHTAINTFYNSLDKSILGNTLDILAGTPADPDFLNSIMIAASQDLQALYKEIGVLDKLISANFNSIAVGKEEIIQTSRRISNKLGDHLLYADPLLGAGFFFSDSFNSLDKIDTSSDLVEQELCYCDVNEGVILLPLDGEPSYPEIKSIVINNSSNGVLGNNHQIGVYGHNNIEAIGDNKPNTWCEYEKVVVSELLSPLILDLTFILNELSIINFININPLFFGTATPLNISIIETSKDGKDFVSIKDEIPIKDFTPEEEDNIFILSATSVNNNGQGSYSFLPRRVKYIHIVLQQSTPYTIETINGVRLRYAIGIRDINIASRKFKTTGSIVSSIFNSAEDIRKISLWSAENPIEYSSLADISHLISYDDGGSWLPIQPQARTSNLIPEILNFNTIAENSVTTEEEVLSFRHKMIFTRNPESFTGEYSIKEEEIEKLDIVSTPSPSNPEVSLTQKPIKESLVAILPYMGSFSCPRDRYGSNVLDESVPMDLDFVEFIVDAPGSISGTDPSGNPQQEGTLRYSLPYKNIPNLPERVRVFINGAQIEYRPKDDYFFDNPLEFTPNPINIDDQSRIYYLNKGGTELQFGYKQKTGSGAGYQRGFIPSSGSKIQVCLDGDNPYIELTDHGFVLNLLVPSDGYKETVSIVALKTLENESASQYEIEIPTGQRVFQAPILKDMSIGEYFADEGDNSFKIPLFLEGTSNFIIKEYNLDGDLITGSDRQFTTAEDYVNGRFELQSFFGDELRNRYTFDSDTGTVYLGTEAPSDRKTILVCNKIDAEKIIIGSWEFDKDISTGQLNPQNILLDPSAVYTFKQYCSFALSSSNIKTIELVTDNTKSHSWFNKKIVKGTVKPAQTLFAEGVSPVEVSYIDGQTEFTSITVIDSEPVNLAVSGSISSSVNLYSFTLSKPDSTKEFIGTPVFSVVRSTNSATTYSNRFSIDGQVSSISNIDAEGEWAVTVDSSTGYTTVTIAAQAGILTESYTITYRINNTNTGLDSQGLYSIDYTNGIFYLSNPAAGAGNIEYEISMYSCFYNIGKIIDFQNIEEINEDESKIIFKPSFAMQFLKQKTSEKSRPQIIKILYNYYKRISESLADLEPYFSPICKQIGIRAVTSSLLEEL